MAARRPIVFLMGPTAVGKTALAVALVERLPLEIVSVDSAMVYRGLDIGTGKPDAALQARAPHRLIDIREPQQSYSAAEFRRDALAAIEEIHERGRWPLLVGGTGLYFRALRRGLSALPPANRALRERLAAEARSVGWARLHARLERADPQAAARIRPSDPQRIQRALEVVELTGTPISRLQALGAAAPCPYPIHALSVEPSARSWLHERIEQRFRTMLADGLIDEVRTLVEERGLAAELPSMRAVGYRQVREYLTRHGDRARMVDEALAATRQLARRQLTWLRHEAELSRVAAEASGMIDTVCALVAPRLGL